MLAADLYYDTGRAAYLAAFHAAQAVIFERNGKVVKTHKGVNIESLRLTKEDPAFSAAFSPRPTISKPSPITTPALSESFQ